ncbi:MAG: adenosylcobinamide-GDP ribazoletransferase [Nitrososphaerales archaeon]
MIRGLASLIKFLTIIPLKPREDDLVLAAKNIHLFPLIGFLLGFLGGLFYLVLSVLLPPLIVGFLTLFFLSIINGFHHLDGLMDFGDGLMCKGSREDKLKAMKDIRVGVGGIALGFFIISVTSLSLPSIPRGSIIAALMVSEGFSKFSMVLLALMGSSAKEGTNRIFIEEAKKRKLKVLFTSLILASLVSFFLISLNFISLLIISFILPLIINSISKGSFGGLTGDVFGATNEIVRMVSLLALIAFL